MPTLRDIRQHIHGVQSTQKITKSMKTMAMVRLQKQEQRTRNSRPFSDTVLELLGFFGEALPEEMMGEEPFFAYKESGPELWVVFSSDRGLCGSFNSNLLRQVDQELSQAKAQSRDVEIIWIGLKGLQHAERRGYPIRSSHIHLPAEPSLEISRKISAECQKAFLEEGTREVSLFYNHFASVVRREVRKVQFLPVAYTSRRRGSGKAFPLYLFEPDVHAILHELLPLYLETKVYQTLLESNASEHAARMMTMDQATTNAQTLIDGLSRSYHKARQAAITRELVEVVSAAEAL